MNIRELSDAELNQHYRDYNRTAHRHYEEKDLKAEIKRRKDLREAKDRIESLATYIAEYEQWIADARAEIAKQEKRIARLEKAP